jgi:hypothetical protein
LTLWEKRIIAAFIDRYPSSAAAQVGASTGAPAVNAAAGEGETVPGTASGPSSAAAAPGTVSDTAAPPAKSPRPLRLRPDRIVPGFDRASPDERESCLEAAESLEGRGLLSLVWARHRKGETLSALVCRDPELLYELTGKDSPKTTAEKVRNAARSFAAIAGTVPEEAALFFFSGRKLHTPGCRRGN